MNKKHPVKNKRTTALWWWTIANTAFTIAIVTMAYLAYVNTSIPIASFTTGSCPPRTTIRYSIDQPGDLAKFSEAMEKERSYQEGREAREARTRASGIAEGCSFGNTHELYR